MVSQISFVPNHNCLISLESSGTSGYDLIVRDIDSQSKVTVLHGILSEFAVHPFENVIAVTTGKQEVILIDISTKEIVSVPYGGDSYIAYHPSGNFFVTTTLYQNNLQPTLTIWDSYSLEPIWQNAYDFWVVDPTFSPDGNYLAVQVQDKISLLNVTWN